MKHLPGFLAGAATALVVGLVLHFLPDEAADTDPLELHKVLYAEQSEDRIPGDTRE